MKVPIGPHQRAGMLRRRFKAVIIAAILVALTVTASLCRVEMQEPKKEPSASELATARNLYKINGDRGDAHIYIEKWPEYADYIMGK